MIKQKTSLLVLLTGTLILPFLITSNTAYGDDFTPPPPDKTKTLPADDGGPHGCDSSRFKCVMGGAAVQDKQTGLIWLRDTRFDNKKIPWQKATDFCQSFELGDKKDWRLPTRDELINLLDTSKWFPALPEGQPFKLRDAAYKDGGGYWTSTDYEGDSNYAWRITMDKGRVGKSHRLMGAGIWPVHDSN